jgi:hypothetical protein
LEQQLILATVGSLSNLHRKARALLGLGVPAAPPTDSQSPSGIGAGGNGAANKGALGAAESPVIADPNVHFRQPTDAEIGVVVASLLSVPGRTADAAQVNDFLQNAAVRRIDLSLLRLAERRGRLLFCLLPVLSPGRTALVLASPAPSASSD